MVFSGFFWILVHVYSCSHLRTWSEPKKSVQNWYISCKLCSWVEQIHQRWETQSWSLRAIKWITVEEQEITHEWHLIYSNLIAQKLNMGNFRVCSVLCDESITLLKKIFWEPAVSLVYCYGHIIYCSPLETSF